MIHRKYPNNAESMLEANQTSTVEKLIQYLFFWFLKLKGERIECRKPIRHKIFEFTAIYEDKTINIRIKNRYVTHLEYNDVKLIWPHITSDKIYYVNFLIWKWFFFQDI